MVYTVYIFLSTSLRVFQIDS